MSTQPDLTTILDLQAALKKIESLSSADVVDDPSVLASAIGAALAPKAPSGSPTQIYSAATAYGKTAERYGQAFGDLQRVNTTTLPAAWKSPAADKAAQHIKAIGIQIQNTVSAFSLVSEAFVAWSDALQRAQQNDQQGRELLAQAGNVGPVTSGRTLGLGYGMSVTEAADQALSLAAEGCSTRQAAALALAVAASSATSVLTQTTGYATAQKIVDAGPLTAMLMSTALNPDGTPILSLNTFTMGMQRWDALSAQDRTAFEELLASSASPQEAAYLWEALAAGNSVKTVEAFDKAIRPYGNNPEWLTDHLDPDLDGHPGVLPGNGNGFFATYKGKTDGELSLVKQILQHFPGVFPDDIYDQGDIGDCVAASTVVARASVDPVYMLGLTTGFDPASSNPTLGDDSPGAFHARLQQAYTGAFRKDQTDSNALANQVLSPATSTPYQYQSLGSTASRAQALQQIEANAGSGVPVLIDVESPPGTPAKDFGAHQVVVVGYNGANNQLEIYNPWGFTQNVDASKFVDGQLPINYNGTSTGAMPDAYGVEMPNG